MRMKRCICGFMATVDEWNGKGIVMYCPECGGYDLKRDELYEMAMKHRMTLAYVDRHRRMWAKDSESEDIDDEAYKAACEMAVEMVDELFRGIHDAEEAWRDERREEVDYLWRATAGSPYGRGTARRSARACSSTSARSGRRDGR